MNIHDRIRQGASRNRRAIIVGVAVLLLATGTPAAARTIADYARNADKVDGRHAVAASATVNARKGRIVATSPHTGRLPNNIISTAPNAGQLDGRDSSAYLRGRTVRTRYLSCAASTWTPNRPTAEVWTDGALTYSGNNGAVRCGVSLPHQAWITGVAFAVRDSHTARRVECILERVTIANPIGSRELLSTAATSIAETSGDVRIVGELPEHLIVDNNRFVYAVLCVLGTSVQIGVFGATVKYKITDAGTTPAGASAPTAVRTTGGGGG